MIIEKAFTKLFNNYGRLLATSQTVFWLSLLIPILSTSLLGLGNLSQIGVHKEANAVRLYTPAEAPSWYEQDILQEHWPLNPDEFTAGRNLNYKRFAHFIIRSKHNCPATSDEGCNLMDGDYLPAIQRLEQYIATNISVQVNGTDFYYDSEHDLASISTCMSFWGLCSRMAKTNGPLNLLIDRELYENRSVHISYPFVKPKAGSSIYWAYNLGGVDLDESDSVRSVKAVRFSLTFNTLDPKMDAVAQSLETKIVDYVYGDYQMTEDSKLLLVTASHSRSIGQGLQASTARLVPRFAVTFSLLALFCFLNMMKLKTGSSHCLAIDCVKSKPWLALCGIVTALMGIISGFGMLFLMDFEFDDICSVVPFLVISIGVDDMFILVAGWHSTSEWDTLADRMAHTLGDAAVAITITSLTSSLSFAIGCLTTIHAVYLFCMYASVCIVFDYLYQVTFFAAFMTHFGRSEMAKRNCFLLCRWGRSGNIKDNSTDNKIGADREVSVSNVFKTPDRMTISPTSTETTELSRIQYFFRNHYGPLLLHYGTKFLVLIIYIVYLVGAVYGLWHMQQGLKFQKMLLAEDPTAIQLDMADRYMQAGAQVEIIFNNPPNMVHKVNRDKVEAIIQEFENSGLTFGPAGTMFWMREYERYRTEINGWQIYDTPEVWVQGVLSWSRQFSYYITWGLDLAWIENPQGSREQIVDGTHHDIKNNYNTCDSRTCLKAFRCRVALTEGNEATDVLNSSVIYREIASRYPEYNITTFQLFRQLADQMLVVLPNTVQNVAIAIGCMAVVSLLFIPNPVCTVWIVLALASIDLGVAGYLSWWSINLDQISMITIVMSIGFSIDFTAHIIYGYVSAPSDFTDDEKCVQAMERLAWPVFQGGISTVIGVSVLTFVDSYMIKAFFKTVFLVVLFGIAHALVFLPVLLSSVMPLLKNLSFKMITKKKIDQSQEEETKT